MKRNIYRGVLLVNCKWGRAGWIITKPNPSLNSIWVLKNKPKPAHYQISVSHTRPKKGGTGNPKNP